MENKTEANADPFSLVKNIKTRGPAPVHLWDPPFCGDMDMRIARDGSWYHEGSLIRRPAMVKLFASILKREDDGEFYLVTPEEKVRIQVEDCPFVATAVDISGRGKRQQLDFTTNLAESFLADANHAITVDDDPLKGEPHPIVHVRNGLNALINRNVFYQLVAAAEHREYDNFQITGIWSSGTFFELGRFAVSSA